MIYPPPWIQRVAGSAEDAGRETIPEGVLRTFAHSPTSCGRIDNACFSAAKQGGEVRKLESRVVCILGVGSGTAKPPLPRAHGQEPLVAVLYITLFIIFPARFYG